MSSEADVLNALPQFLKNLAADCHISTDPGDN